MTTAPRLSPSLTAILFALAGSVVFSVNDMAIKWLSGDYALHQVILTRALIGMVFLFGVMAMLRVPFRSLMTVRPRGHLLRVVFVVISNLTYFLGLAALPLADAVTISFVSPLMITVLSVFVLGERVGPRRWAAVGAGLLGVLIMFRPGTGVFEPAAILVLISAVCYAATNLMTRAMKATESAFSLQFYVQCGFIVVCTAMGLTVGDGRFAGSDNASLAFLLRGWVWPAAADWPAFIASGVAVSVGGLMIGQAYRLGEAGLVAPFEYISVPIAVIWGLVIFGTLPDAWGWAGIALIVGAGLYTLWRETRVQ
ncbi:MAG: DMT family transporter [Paracoccaceae bacterium]